MALFLIIPLLILFALIAEDLISKLKLSRFFPRKKQHAHNPTLEAYQMELDRIENDPDLDDFVRTVRKLRVNRKIEEFWENSNPRANQFGALSTYWIDTAVPYAVRFVFYIILAVISIKYRTTPVLLLTESISLWPIGSLLTYPTGMTNAISVPIWVLSSNIAIRNYYGALKKAYKIDIKEYNLFKQ